MYSYGIFRESTSEKFEIFSKHAIEMYKTHNDFFRTFDCPDQYHYLVFLARLKELKFIDIGSPGKYYWNARAKIWLEHQCSNEMIKCKECGQTLPANEFKLYMPIGKLPKISKVCEECRTKK